MPRAIWTGTVGFGLVQIPVGLYPAEDRSELEMTMLDKRDFSPVGYQRINKHTGKEVPWEQIVKGYEHKDGKYVVLNDQDFERANVEASRQIDILDFVEFTDIDPRYIERPYYVVPQKVGRKSYALLREALHRTGKAGIGKVVLRTRQHLAALVAEEDALLLILMRFSDELRDSKELDLPSKSPKAAGIDPKELSMAERLIAGMVGEFRPEKYRDDYRQDLMKLIQRKAKAGEVNTLPTESKERRKAPKQTVVDLAELLAKSVAGSKKHARGKQHATAHHPAGKHATAHHAPHHRKSA